MNLYVVSRWGNDEDPDGPNATDTSFLICAADHWSAIAIVDETLRYLPHDHVAPYAHSCLLIGSYHAANAESRILWGPVIKSFFNHDNAAGWIRQDGDSPWISLEDFHKGFDD